MKRIEVSLNVGVVAPLLDFIKPVIRTLETETAFGPEMASADGELQSVWREGLIQTQVDDCQKLLGLFGAEFCDSGRIQLTADVADSILRAAAAVRLKLRGTVLKDIKDEEMSSESPDLRALSEAQRRGFAAYVFLATIQEIIIKHLGDL